MASNAPTRHDRHVRSAVITLVAVVVIASISVLSPSPLRSPSGAVGTLLTTTSVFAAPSLDSIPRVQQRSLGLGDGEVPSKATVFDDSIPAVSGLSYDLLLALRKAANDAAKSKIVFNVESGWRSPAYQKQLLSEAVAKYGSEAQAARWVATPETSAHVTGDAIDIGPNNAAAWLSKHGAKYGLCQVYKNEPWHFEYRAGAKTSGCPKMYPDPTYDPRMTP